VQQHTWILERVADGRTERVEWIRAGDCVTIIANGTETVIGPEAWQQTWADLESRGFVEVSPVDRARLNEEKKRISELVRDAFEGITLGHGVGLRQADGLEDYADDQTLAEYRAQDEKDDWSAIPVGDLNRYQFSPCFFDAEGMRFHLPAYLIADLEGCLTHTDILFHLVHFDILGFTRYELLTDLQRQAVREFLLLCLKDHEHRFVHEEIEKALKDYWIAV
jgi:hypothetical protein